MTKTVTITIEATQNGAMSVTLNALESGDETKASGAAACLTANADAALACFRLLAAMLRDWGRFDIANTINGTRRCLLDAAEAIGQAHADEATEEDVALAHQATGELVAASMALRVMDGEIRPGRAEEPAEELGV